MKTTTLRQTQGTALNPSSSLNVEGIFSSPLEFLKSLVRTRDASSLLILRLALAVTLFPHGAQKALGWFGGYGFSATINAFGQYMHIPAPLALAVIATEFLGS